MGPSPARVRFAEGAGVASPVAVSADASPTSPSDVQIESLGDKSVHHRPREMIYAPLTDFLDLTRLQLARRLFGQLARKRLPRSGLSVFLQRLALPRVACRRSTRHEGARCGEERGGREDVMGGSKEAPEQMNIPKWECRVIGPSILPLPDATIIIRQSLSKAHLHVTPKGESLPRAGTETQKPVCRPYFPSKNL